MAEQNISQNISQNEIKTRALAFQNSWVGVKRERAEKDSFWNEFFEIFGINRRRVASFETAVKRSGNRQGFIDCFWEGVILIEHKSKGANLEKASDQAMSYLSGLTQEQLPKYILVSDFNHFNLQNLETSETWHFELGQFLENIELFNFISGYKQIKFVAEDPVNIQASELMGDFHDAIRQTGFEGHQLELFLTRILFILFAEDTQILQKRQFQDFILRKTNQDGTNTGSQIQMLFQILNTPHSKRPKNLDEELANFDYINGQLFADITYIPSFDSKIRANLIKCCEFDWSKISPAVFGSLFQSVMNPEQRRTFGAHYTEEKNILKTIEPLFLDELWLEFESILHNKKKLAQFHTKLSKLTFFDPACGCGNFLIITYREIRKLELAILLELHGNQKEALDVASFSILNVNQFYGIEIEEFPAQIAKTALWLTDHIANLELSRAFGQYYARIPLSVSATILHGNSLTTSWESVILPQNLSYIIGNPPFVGSKMLNVNQRAEIVPIIGHIKNYGILDYVCNWFVKSANMMSINPNIQTAFVSTNSIYQGEQVGVLWGYLIENCGLKIKFAHQTFAWSSEARGKANVFCCIAGFYKEIDRQNSPLFENLNQENSHSLVKGWQSQTDGVAPQRLILPYNPKLKEKARELRKAGNLSEVLFWNAVKNKQLLEFDFDRQRVIGDYIVDFYCTKNNLVIEIDGQSHDLKSDYDEKREKFLTNLGLRVIHFEDIEIKKNLNQVLEGLYQYLKKATPSLRATPSQVNGNLRITHKLYTYENPKSDPVKTIVASINPYLVEGEAIVIRSRQNPISDVPEIFQGNNYAKSEGLIIESEDLDYFIKNEPNAKKYVKKLIGAREFLNNTPRYCLWLFDCPPNDLRKMPLVMERLERVKKDRLVSKDKGMHKLALTPSLFRETKNPDKCLIIPVVSSESRDYIPMAFIDKDTITINANLMIEGATLFHFGILTSKMHMAWVNRVCGRLESRFRYSKDIVYNNFPFPDAPKIEDPTKERPQSLRDSPSEGATANQTSPFQGRCPKGSSNLVAKIESLAQKILDVRAKYQNSNLKTLPQDKLEYSLERKNLSEELAPFKGLHKVVGSCSLADLYNPLSMPPNLAKAHNDLDKAVEKLYLEQHLQNSPLVEAITVSPKPSFATDSDRVAFLFALYKTKLGALDFAPDVKPKKMRKSKKTK